MDNTQINDQERYYLVDILNSIADQAKFIRNCLVYNSKSATIDINIEISCLVRMTNNLNVYKEIE
jgi:hypothetical protein